MSTDVVCVLDAKLAQVFALARPVKATVKPDSKLMEHPLETGASIADHRIVLPVEIELSLVLVGADTFRNTYKEVRDLFSRGELLTVQTRTDSYPNMAIQSMPHEETPDSMDAVTLAMTLKEVTFVNAQFSDLQVKHKKDSKTVKRGEQQGSDAAPKQQSILSGIFSR